MWTVTCDYVRGVLTYFVENKITGEPWAREMADELNREENK